MVDHFAKIVSLVSLQKSERKSVWNKSVYWLSSVVEEEKETFSFSVNINKDYSMLESNSCFFGQF